MMQNAPPLGDASPAKEVHDVEEALEEVATTERTATVWVSRITGAVGAMCLLLALALWLLHHGHYRAVLAFLIVAMFASILHSYTFENGGQP
jgi:hypothetical protein